MTASENFPHTYYYVTYTHTIENQLPTWNTAVFWQIKLSETQMKNDLDSE